MRSPRPVRADLPLPGGDFDGLAFDCRGSFPQICGKLWIRPARAGRLPLPRLLRQRREHVHAYGGELGHLTKGQRAMAVAKICPVSGQSVREASKTASVGKSRVSQASVVLSYAPDLADSVLSGATSLDTAYRRPGRIHPTSAID